MSNRDTLAALLRKVINDETLGRWGGETAPCDAPSSDTKLCLCDSGICDACAGKIAQALVARGVTAAEPAERPPEPQLPESLRRLIRAWEEMADYDEQIVPAARVSAASALRTCADDVRGALGITQRLTGSGAARVPVLPDDKVRRCIEQIVGVMQNRDLRDDIALSEIQDFLHIAGFDNVPLRSYDTDDPTVYKSERGVPVLQPEPSDPAGLAKLLCEMEVERTHLRRIPHCRCPQWCGGCDTTMVYDQAVSEPPYNIYRYERTQRAERGYCDFHAEMATRYAEKGIEVRAVDSVSRSPEPDELSHRHWAIANVRRYEAKPLSCGHDQAGAGLQYEACVACAWEMGRREGHVEAGAYLTHEEAMTEIRSHIREAGRSSLRAPTEPT